jgi:DNA-binding transcriptional ArsR family regulator
LTIASRHSAPRPSGRPEFDCTQPAISHHLKVLREAGLVNNRVDAQRRLHTLNRAGLDTLDAPCLVEFDWTGGPNQLQASRVRFELTAEGTYTRLVLTHTRDIDAAGPDFAAGWHGHLDTLTALAAGAQTAPDRPTWDQLYRRYQEDGRQRAGG